MAKSANKYNFETFLKKNIKKSTEKMKRMNKMTSFKKYLDDPTNKLG